MSIGSKKSDIFQVLRARPPNGPPQVTPCSDDLLGVRKYYAGGLISKDSINCCRTWSFDDKPAG